LRDIEELSTAETAQALELSEDNVKVRLHRGHGMVRSWLFDRIGSGAKEAFPFMGIRCNRVVEGVFDRLTQRSTSDSSPQWPRRFLAHVSNIISLICRPSSSPFLA